MVVILVFGIYLANRYWSQPVASTLFLCLFIAIIAFAEEPLQIVEGRSTFLFTVPILMASVILRPWASFVMAGVVSLVMAVLQFYHNNQLWEEFHRSLPC